MHGSGRGPHWGPAIEAATFEDVDATWFERSGHASFRRAIGTHVTLAAGLRLADSTLVDQRAIDRWVQVEWSAARWLVHGSTGVMHQFADLEHVRGWEGSVGLQPERATYADVGIGQRLTESVRWDVTVYTRRERDALRPPDIHGRLIDGIPGYSRAANNRFENVLRGSAHGTEMRIERRSQTGYSGWIGYSYGVARYTDATRQETFQADFDQRHGINASGIATLAWKMRVGMTFRGGTNFPIPGYLVARGGHLFSGDRAESGAASGICPPRSSRGADVRSRCAALHAVCRRHSIS